jgi:RNA polymerase sigma factor (sigma-70 family)
MNTREIHRPLEASALAEIEGAVRGKLKAYNLSDSFIERCIEDAVQKGLVEYLRALDKGEVVENRNGFVVRAAFVRAIDELRHEARQADGAALDAIIESGGGSSEPATDELAIEFLQAEELRTAVHQLSPEEQQVLSLHYFEEMTAEASAEALFCSERTYRRRLKQALGKLGQMLDAPVPEPGSELAIEIGVVVWVGLRGARVVLAQGPLEQFWTLVTETLAGRAESANRNSERIVAILNSSPGRVAGGCLAACILAVGGAELAGVGDRGGEHHPASRPPLERIAKQPQPVQKVVTAPPVPPPGGGSSTRTAPDAESHATSAAATAKKKEHEANEEVNTQGTGSLFPEEGTASEPASPAPAPVESSSPPSTSSTPNALPESQGAGGLVQP